MFKKKKVNLIHFFLDVMLLYDMVATTSKRDEYHVCPDENSSLNKSMYKFSEIIYSKAVRIGPQLVNYSCISVHPLFYFKECVLLEI